MKALNALQEKADKVGVKFENVIDIIVVDGIEHYGESLDQACKSACVKKGKPECHVTSPGKLAGHYEMTIGGKAVKVS